MNKSIHRQIAKEIKILRDKAKKQKDLNTQISKEQYNNLINNQCIDGLYISEVQMDTVYTYAYNTNPNLNTYTKLRAYHMICLNYLLASTNTKEYKYDDEDDYDY